MWTLGIGKHTVELVKYQILHSDSSTRCDNRSNRFLWWPGGTAPVSGRLSNKIEDCLKISLDWKFLRNSPLQCSLKIFCCTIFYTDCTARLFFLLLFRRYSHWWGFENFDPCQFLNPSTRIFDPTPSIHLDFGRPTILRPSGLFRNRIERALFEFTRARCQADLNLWTFTTSTMSG